MSRISPEAKAKLAALLRARMQTPEYRARLSDAARARCRFTPEQEAICRRMADDGASSKEIGRALGINYGTVAARAARHGIDLGERARRFAAGDAVVRAHYGTMMPTPDVFALFRVARGGDVTQATMQQRAVVLGVRRPAEAEEARFRQLAAERQAWAIEARRPRLVAVQQVLDTGATLKEAARQLGINPKTITEWRRDGLVTKPEGAPTVRAPRKVRPARDGMQRAEADNTARMRARAAPVQARIDAGERFADAVAAEGIPIKTAGRWRWMGVLRVPAAVRGTRAAAKPRPARKPMPWAATKLRPVPKPAPRAQTVEEWLAAGGVITRCPTAVAAPVAGVSLSDADVAAHRAHEAAIARNLKRHGGNAWKAQRAAFFANRRKAA